MPAILSGVITAFYLFDVAEEIDLAAVPGCVQAQTAAARLAPKPVTPAYLQYESPAPLLIDGEAVQMGEVDGFRVRFKLFEYGVVSLALTRPFSGSWGELLAVGQRLVGSDGLERQARALCARLAEPLAPVLKQARGETLS